VLTTSGEPSSKAQSLAPKLFRKATLLGSDRKSIRHQSHQNGRGRSEREIARAENKSQFKRVKNFVFHMKQFGRCFTELELKLNRLQPWPTIRTHYPDETAALNQSGFKQAFPPERSQTRLRANEGGDTATSEPRRMFQKRINPGFACYAVGAVKSGFCRVFHRWWRLKLPGVIAVR